MIRYLLLLALLFVARLTPAQQLPEINASTHITASDKTIVAGIRPVESKVKTMPAKLYYWYSAGMIHQTQGGYSGKLLNGDYNEYYLSKSLKEQGIFDKGLKSGVWKTWDETGTLKQLLTYNQGLKNGLFEFYDSGTLKQSGTYKNDALNGKITFYYKDSTVVVRYKNGVTVSKKSSFWDKFPLLKKHPAPPAGKVKSH